MCKKYLYIACTFIKEKQKNLFLMPEIIRKHFVSRQIPDLLFVSFSSIKIKTFYWRPFPVRHGIHIEKRNADRFFNRLVALNRKQLIDFLSLHMKVTLRYSYPFKSRYVNDRKAMSRYDLAANQFLWKNGKFSSLYWKIWDIE